MVDNSSADEVRMPEPPAPPLEAPSAPLEAPSASEPLVVRTDADAKDGLSKCPACGATQISLNIATGMLRCGYCRHEWQTANAMQSLGLDGDIGLLRGVTVGSGSADIVPSTDEVVTLKCTACGAEVVIDTANSLQARCHWCRNTLSMNEQLPNGAVPDMVLPFSLTKDEAVKRIAEFVGKRKFFAHPRFRSEFNPENVLGVYLPYMVVDVNASAVFRGQGEHQTRSYTVKSGDDEERRYDADLYDVRREFDLHVDDLTVESSAERRDQSMSRNTNNIINSIMPFDVDKSVRYDANYLAGFTSERRDTNVADLAETVTAQTRDIARYKTLETISFYDRGVRWDEERLDVHGQRWVSAYLPVWLYSYYEQKGGGRGLLHYVAVNGRTGETMGSVPLHHGKLLAVSAAVEVVGVILFLIFMLLGR